MAKITRKLVAYDRFGLNDESVTVGQIITNFKGVSGRNVDYYQIEDAEGVSRFLQSNPLNGSFIDSDNDISFGVVWLDTYIDNEIDSIRLIGFYE